MHQTTQTNPSQQDKPSFRFLLVAFVAALMAIVQAIVRKPLQR